MHQRVFIYILLFFSALQAQSKADFGGTIIDSKSQQAIPFACIHILNTDQWTTSDASGKFSFQAIELEKVKIRVKVIAYQEHIQEYNTASNITIALAPQNYAIDEVIVTAEQGQGLSTSSKINNAAMEHVQPTTLGDVMQLLPGNLIKNPDLSKKQVISIREISSDDNSADGTALVIDGAPIDNDANMQSAILSGIDLRQISTHNIESIEVIKGIPSVSYGNLTSGALVVKTKSGYTPYKVKFKTDPKLKNISISKGMRLNQGAAINTSVDYTRSFQDLRSKYKGFNRLTAQMGYSNTFLNNKTPLSFNSKLSLHTTLDKARTDPDAMQADELFQSKETGLRLNIFGQWLLNKKWISKVNYSVRASMKAQEEYDQSYRSSGLNRISYAQEKGENQGIYLSSESLTELYIKGLPLSLYAQTLAQKSFSYQNGFTNKTMLGLDYRLSGNYGEGRVYDIMNPPTISYSSSRPRSFKDIPALETLAFFAENKTSIPIYNTSLELMAGLRLNNFQPTSISQGDAGIYWEPRLNLRYTLREKNNTWMKKLSIHAGIGLNYKAASMQYLYPDPAYFDVLVLDYYPSQSEQAQVWFNTHIIEDTSNPNLKPSKNFKKEIGFNFKIGKITGDLTYFDEALSDGFGLQRKYIYTHNTYYHTDGIADNAIIDKNTLPRSDYSYILSYPLYTNNKASNKQGLEYSFNFGKIDALSTRITMNGAWLRTKRIYSTEDYAHLPSKTIGSGQYQEIGIYPAGESKVSERMNTTFRFVTHIPKMRLIFTTSLQMTWIDKYHYNYYEESPIYLMTESGSLRPFTEAMSQQAPYSYDYIKQYGVNYFLEEQRPPLFLCNFKLSKEIADCIKLSFYANNFINHRPIYYSERSHSYSRRNPAIYFGAEIHITL